MFPYLCTTRSYLAGEPNKSFSQLYDLYLGVAINSISLIIQSCLLSSSLVFEVFVFYVPLGDPIDSLNLTFQRRFELCTTVRFKTCFTIFEGSLTDCKQSEGLITYWGQFFLSTLSYRFSRQKLSIFIPYNAGRCYLPMGRLQCRVLPSFSHRHQTSALKV